MDPGENGLEIDEPEFIELELQRSSSLHPAVPVPFPVLAQETYGVEKSLQSTIGAYEIKQTLGMGAFGKVYLVRKEGTCFAMKQFSKASLRKKYFAPDFEFTSGQERLDNELEIIKRLSHRNIAVCSEIIYSNDYIYTISTLGDLGQITDFDQVKGNFSRSKKVTDFLAKQYGTHDIAALMRIIFTQVCEAVQFIHKNNITNRDIKTQNIVCRSNAPKGEQILIIDFTTVRYNHNDISFNPVGTPGFRAPEIMDAEQGYSCRAADVWSVGISMYVYFFEIFPFWAETEFEIDLKAKNQDLQFGEKCPAFLKKVISQMTHKDRTKRCNIEQALALLQNVD